MWCETRGSAAIAWSDVMCCVKKVAAGARIEGCDVTQCRSVGDVGAGEKLDVEESFAAKCNNTTYSHAHV